MFFNFKQLTMKTNELIKEIQKLPVAERIYVMERSMHLIRKQEEEDQMKKAAEDNRIFPSPYRPSNAGFLRRSFARWRSQATGLRWNRRPVFRAGRGIDVRMPKEIRRIGVGLRRKWCQKQARISRSRTVP